MTIKRILCPTALTAGSDGALRFALALARAYDAKLIAFHCKPANGNGVLAQREVKVSLEESIFQRLEIAELSTIDWSELSKHAMTRERQSPSMRPSTALI